MTAAANLRKIERALVLGGHGFLGTWLVRALEQRGVRVTVVDTRSPGAASAATHEYVQGEIEHIDLAGLIAQTAPDAVFHLASPAYVPPSFEDPVDNLIRTVGTTLAVLEALKGARSKPLLVYASTAAVYGEGVVMPMEESTALLTPVSPYGVSKLAAEKYIEMYVRVFGLPAVVARPFSIYGPGQRKQVVYDVLMRALAGPDELTLLGTAEVSRDLVYVADAAETFVALAERAPGAGSAYNVASGRGTALADLAKAVLDACALRIPVTFSGSVRTGDPLHWVGSVARMQELGIYNRTDLADGLRSTLDWIRSNSAPSSR